MRGIQYAAALVIGPRRRGILDRPPSRTMTSSTALTNTRMLSLVARPLRVVEHLESFLELRRDRDVEFFAGGQARNEPLVVERNQIAVRTELAKSALHHRRKLGLALAEHDAVGIVGQIFAGDADF